MHPRRESYGYAYGRICALCADMQNTCLTCTRCVINVLIDWLIDLAETIHQNYNYNYKQITIQWLCNIYQVFYYMLTLMQSSKSNHKLSFYIQSAYRSTVYHVSKDTHYATTTTTHNWSTMIATFITSYITRHTAQSNRHVLLGLRRIYWSHVKRWG